MALVYQAHRPLRQCLMPLGLSITPSAGVQPDTAELAHDTHVAYGNRQISDAFEFCSAWMRAVVFARRMPPGAPSPSPSIVCCCSCDIGASTSARAPSLLSYRFVEGIVQLHVLAP